MGLRDFILVTHRWLGLASAIVLVIAGATGAVLVWPSLSPRWVSAVHDSLFLGRAGMLIVLAATTAAVALQAGGLFLWWRTKTIRIRTKRGWRALVTDVHYSTGVLALAIMLVIALSALGRVAMRVLDRSKQHGDLGRTVSRLHTTNGYPVAIKVLYTAGSLGFVIQGVTGVLMWWRPKR